MTLSEIRLRLCELGVRPSRRLGQNFLHDQNLAARIVELAGIQTDEAVLEIGPGLGALTERLAAQTARLVLIEKDRRLAGFLRNRFPQAQVIEADALQELSAFSLLGSAAAGRGDSDAVAKPTPPQRQALQPSAFVAIGNLPYSVASPLIVRLCEPDLRPLRMVFTVQLEVGQRLTALPRTRDFGLLTLFTQPFYEIRLVRKLAPTVFWPRPGIVSAVIVMTRRQTQPFASTGADAHFRGMVRRAFQSRRKTLGAIFDALPTGIDPRRRPEELSVAEWLALSVQTVTTAGPAQAVSVETEMFDVVNERDEVTGQETRPEVHRKKLFHRAIHILLWNHRGELLLQFRSATKDVAPNTWDSSAAGHLAVSEEYDAAALREVAEELGVTPVLRRVRKFAPRADLGWEFVWLYEGKSEGPFQYPTSEIARVRWWTPAEIDAAIEKQPQDFAASFRHIWKLVGNANRPAPDSDARSQPS